MKRLFRHPEGPGCLDSHERRRKEHSARGAQYTWEELSSQDSDEIRMHLNRMQSEVCAYCECSCGTVRKHPKEPLKGHIEHFRPRNAGRARDVHGKPLPFPELTFSWTNLLWSCNRATSCGTRKDGAKTHTYQPEDLIDPTKEDPDRFFRFRESGRIEVRTEALSPTDRRRAETTLCVLGLDDDDSFGGLRAQRRQTLDTFRNMNPDILEFLEELTEAERRDWIREEVSAARGKPFSAVIRQFLSINSAS